MSTLTDRSHRPTYRETVALLAAAQKGRAAGSPAYSVFVNRPAGRLLAAAAHRAGLGPDQVTAVSAACSGAGILVLALVPPTAWSGVLVAFLLALGYALDSADGQVARLRGGGSVAGEWLDHVIDCLKISLLHTAVLLAAVRFFDVPAVWLLVPLGFAVADNALFFAQILNDSLKQIKGAPLRRPGAFRPWRSFVLLPVDYGVLCLSFLLLGWTGAFVVVYTLLFAATAGFTALALPKWFHDMRRLG
ncbi:CDP-alcohol phosphatidyltransferase family protein [Kocuria sp. M1R5S2]|uniref:CDP-alcohol phosphatidyltransferase family protein n=1 Tax=Kocuria rhizosphaerae TaxID=3376285 RepID=UPI00378D5252